MKRTTLILILAAGGCFAPTNFTDEMPDDLPAGSCRDTDPEDCETSTGDASSGDATSTGGGTTEPVVDDCDGSEACLGGDACVAAWDPEAEARGPFQCQFACIPLLDEATWCSDDASCCDATAVCTERGYCVLEESESGSSGGGSSGTGS